MFYTPEDRAAGEPERELISATSGVYSAEGWRVRKDGHLEAGLKAPKEAVP
jgi:hypothetical protein